MVNLATWMSRRTLLRSIDSARVKTAIENAEAGTSGHIRVSIAAPFWATPTKPQSGRSIDSGCTEPTIGTPFSF